MTAKGDKKRLFLKGVKKPSLTSCLLTVSLARENQVCVSTASGQLRNQHWVRLGALAETMCALALVRSNIEGVERGVLKLGLGSRLGMVWYCSGW